jgi:Extensin-like protein C-terminus
MFARVLALASLLVLAGCIDRVDRPRVARPLSQPFGTIADSPELRQCIGRLDQVVPRYALLPDRTFEGGCSTTGAVQLRDIGTPVTNLGAIARVESMGTYSCRNIIGAGSNRLSEHGHANAVDVGAFVLADGRRVTVKDGWSNGDEGEFLRAVRASACRRFDVVLSPDYNAAHHDHLHFDMGRGPFCR